MTLLIAAFLALTPPDPWFVIPDVAPKPAPPPPPKPSLVTEIGADELYVVEFKQKAFMLPADASVVSVAQDAGPVRIRGKFVGGGGKVQTKTFAGPQVYVVEAAGAGQCVLTWVKEGAKSPADVLQRTVKAGKGPQPPPDPGPTDDEFKTLEAAYATDTVAGGDKQIGTLYLISYYKTAAMISRKQPAGKYGDYWKTVKAADPASLAGVLPKVRVIVGKDLDKSMPPAKPDDPITRQQLDELAAKFTKWATYLEALNK